MTSGLTATAVLDGNVQGVVVHTSRSARPAHSPLVTGMRTYTEGSVIDSYPWATSWSDRPVPQRGQ